MKKTHTHTHTHTHTPSTYNNINTSKCTCSKCTIILFWQSFGLSRLTSFFPSPISSTFWISSVPLLFSSTFCLHAANSYSLDVSPTYTCFTSGTSTHLSAMTTLGFSITSSVIIQTGMSLSYLFFCIQQQGFLFSVPVKSFLGYHNLLDRMVVPTTSVI